jgi:hypothetical protein
VLTTLLGGPLDGQQLNLSGFTRPTFSFKALLAGERAELFEGAPPTLVCNDDGNFVAVWPDGHRIWPQGAAGFRHYYRAVEGYGYRFERTTDVPIA